MSQKFWKITYFSWVFLLFFVSCFSVFAISENQLISSQKHIETQVKKITSIQKVKQLLNQLESIQYRESINAPYLKNLLIEKRKILEEAEYQKQIEKHSQTQKIFLWYSEWGNEIFAYYKWDPSKPFFWIFANIHGGYEYGTYFTAKYLLEILEKSKKTQWFIIPTINPDGLQIAFENNLDKKYYIQGRENSNWIELNRNFCTENFFVHSYVKLWKKFYSWENCNSQQESKIIDSVLQNFNFSEIISLHSEWWIFFIPDNSYLDPRIISLVEKLTVLLPKYYYEFPTNDDNKNRNIISIVEINSWKKIKKYSGLMENYIYQKYDIPIVLIELKEHWEIEYDLYHILEYL